MAVRLPPQVGDRWRLNVVRVDCRRPGTQATGRVSSWNRITCCDFHALDRMLTVVFADRSGGIVPGVGTEAEVGTEAAAATAAAAAAATAAATAAAAATEAEGGNGSGSGSGNGSGSGSGNGSGNGSGSGSGPVIMRPSQLRRPTALPAPNP